MRFINEFHEKNHAALLEIFGTTSDVQYKTACYLLSSIGTLDGKKGKIEAIGSLCGDGIWFEKMLEEAHLTSSEKGIVLIAADLFGDGSPVMVGSLAKAIRHFGPEYQKVLLEGMSIYFGTNLK